MGAFRPQFRQVRYFPVMVFILLSGLTAQQGWAVSKGADASQGQKEQARRWEKPKKQKKDENKARPQKLSKGEGVEKGPARVRIGLKLRPFKKIVVRQRGGKRKTRRRPAEALKHTLRARIDKLNHFFVGDYHLETKPLKWNRKTRRFVARLRVYQRHGAFGQLEDFVGEMLLRGKLDPQAEKLYVLYGASRKRFRNKFQRPVLDVVAGYSPPPKKKTTISKKTRKRGHVPPRKAPKDHSGPLMRGKF